MKKLCILKTGSTYPNIKKKYGDFDDWILGNIQKSKDQVIIHDAQINQPLPSADRISGIVITGSHAMVTDNDDWIKRIIDWLPDMIESKIPILGICFGHQVLALAMGGKVDFNSRGREIGVQVVKKTLMAEKDLIFNSFPERMEVLESHRQSVIDLPPKAKVLFHNNHDPHQTFVLNKNVWGVQFHPEFNKPIMDAYIYEQKTDLEKEGLDTKKLTSKLNHNNNSKILIKFIEIVETNLNT